MHTCPTDEVIMVPARALDIQVPAPEPEVLVVRADDTVFVIRSE